MRTGKLSCLDMSTRIVSADALLPFHERPSAPLSRFPSRRSLVHFLSGQQYSVDACKPLPDPDLESSSLYIRSHYSILFQLQKPRAPTRFANSLCWICCLFLLVPKMLNAIRSLFGTGSNVSLPSASLISMFGSLLQSLTWPQNSISFSSSLQRGFQVQFVPSQYCSLLSASGISMQLNLRSFSWLNQNFQ